MFSKNQKQWAAKPLDAAVIDAFNKNMESCGYNPKNVLVHDSYLINIGNPDKVKRDKSINALIDEVKRCSMLGLALLNTHPGSHLGIVGEDECIAFIAESLNIVLDKTLSSGVTIVLETTAGQGSNIGYRFEHLAAIIDKIEDKSRIGTCIDTCHIFAAGYDIRDKKTYRQTMDEFSRIVGFRYIRGLHLNDVKIDLGSRVDRHENLGKGKLGVAPFRLLMEDPRFDGITCVLETVDENIWGEEVEMLKSMQGGS
jgi:deoxyribonuclease-4